MVDDVTQFQFVGTVQAISRAASRLWSTSSPSACSPPSSTTTAPACSPPIRSTPRAGVTKRYRDRDVMTPYDKLKSLDHAERFLKSGVTFDQLDAIAHAVSDLDAAHGAQRRPRRTVPHHRAHLERCGLTSHPTRATPPPDHARAVDPPWGDPLPTAPDPLVCPIAAASTFGFRTDQGLHRSFVHFNIALPFTHFPTPTTAPSTSHLQAHLRIGKD